MQPSFRTILVLFLALASSTLRHHARHLKLLDRASSVPRRFELVLLETQLNYTAAR